MGRDPTRSRWPRQGVRRCDAASLRGPDQRARAVLARRGEAPQARHRDRLEARILLLDVQLPAPDRMVVGADADQLWGEREGEEYEQRDQAGAPARELRLITEQALEVGRD